MPYIDKEEVTRLAFKRYKSKESFEKSVWYLAELCCLINRNIKNADTIMPLETDNVVLMLSENVNGELVQPTEEEVTELAELIYHENPEKAKLHWFIAEKSLLLEKIKEIIEDNKKAV